MEETVSTIYNNGQFWVALIEKSGDDGRRSLAKYTFGPEPSAGDLFDFYLNKYQRVVFIPSDRAVKIRKHKKDNLQRVSKSHAEYKEVQQQYLAERKAERKIKHRIEEAEKYQQKRLKRKQKKKGH